jgi:FkbM family methyltransferase
MLGLRNIGVRSILDVGANRGQFAKEALRLFPDAKVFCFEPLPGPFAALDRLTRERGRGRALAYNVALGAAADEAEMIEHVDHDTSSSLLPTTAAGERLYPFMSHQRKFRRRVVRLDDFIREAGIELAPEILVKFDVQGYEAHVLSGATETMSKARACIVEISFDHLYKGQPTFATLWKIFDSLGYRFAGNLEQIYAEDGHVIFADAVFIR